MTLHVGYIPYLNMVPFHQGFGPEPLRLAGQDVVFRSCTPHVLGLEAQRGRIDVGALSLVDLFRLSEEFEPIGDFGIGLKRDAKSVLFFSKQALPKFRGTCAVTDETSTSAHLLQILLKQRHGVADIVFGRVSSGAMYDGSAEGLLLIGDEAMRAKQKGVKGLPRVFDLGEEWHAWKGVPFVFARWAVRRTLPEEVKSELHQCIENSLESMEMHKAYASRVESKNRDLPAAEILAYWDGFAYRLSDDHYKAISLFESFVQNACLTV